MGSWFQEPQILSSLAITEVSIFTLIFFSAESNQTRRDCVGTNELNTDAQTFIEKSF